MNSPREYKSDTIEQLSQSGNPLRRARLPKRMRLAYKIANALEAMDWNNKELTKKLGKKYQSQITRWLKGDHNFTVNTLSDIEEILGIRLLALDEVEEKKTVSRFEGILSTKNDDVRIDRDNPYTHGYIAGAGGIQISASEYAKL